MYVTQDEYFGMLSLKTQVVALRGLFEAAGRAGVVSIRIPTIKLAPYNLFNGFS